MGTWHDSLFQRIYSDPRHAEGLLRCALPRRVVAVVDWPTLCLVSALLVDAGLGSHEADLLFSVRLRGSGITLLILVEHKSDGDHFTVLQLVRYRERIVELWCARNPDERRLPVIISVIFHHGDRPWQAPTSLQQFLLAGSLRELHAADPELAMLLADASVGPAYLDDLARLGETEIIARPDTDLARLTNLSLRFLRRLKPVDALAALERWREILRRQYASPGGAAAMQAVESYILRTTDTTAEQLQASLRRLAGEHAGESIMSTAERLIAEGLAKGRAEGIVKGRAEGKAEGKAETLMRQLRRRFGDLPGAIEQRVRSASIADLDCWADRILDAPTLDAVFAVG